MSYPRPLHRRGIPAAIRATLALVFFITIPGQADPLYPSYDAFRAALTGLGDISDPAERTTAANTFWNELRGAGQVPYAQGNQAALLYRGFGTIAFAGDFNRWNPANGAATQVPGTDLWFFEHPLPPDARVDYKVVRNGSWILDPNNPHQQWSGFGPNSELRMPDYAFPTETVRDPAVPRGQLTPNIRLSSTNLNADVNVRVYTPAGYDALDELPVVYITDGHEYLDDRLGAAVIVLDNLIASGELRPAVAVFIDPRDPDSRQNRRLSQLGGDDRPEFADFIAQELVPYVDANYDTAGHADERVILGTSLGGLFSAYLGARHPDVVSNLAIQSPAFWFDPSIYDPYTFSPTLADALQIYMHTGTVNDDGGGTTMAGILETVGYDFFFETVNQGHSWGHWKGEIGNALIHLLGPVPEPSSAGIILTVPLLAARRRVGTGGVAVSRAAQS